MTRVIVKNLPNSVTSEKLKETFSQRGQVTDVQLKYDGHGKFRHFGFVGFKTDGEADEAMKYFNNTYVGSCKIQVEKCVTLGESATMKKGHQKIPAIPSFEQEPKKDISKKKEREPVDPEFAEFLEVHSKRQEDKGIWDNDGIDGSAPVQADNKATEPNEEDKIAHKKNLSDLDYLKSKVVAGENQGEEKVPVKPAPPMKKEPTANYFTLKIRGFPCQVKKKDIREFFSPLKPDSIRLPPKVKGVAYIGFASEKEWKKALDKHRSVYDGHRICVAKYENKFKPVEAKASGKKEAWIQQETDMKKEETVAESGRIFIRNLSYTVTEEELEALFKPFGPLAEIHLPIDKHSRRIKGFAFATFVLPEHAVKAYTALDGTTFQGRMLHLIAGKSKPSQDDNAGTEGSSYKQKKLKDQKAQASSAHNWNTLFLGTNAVATLMAERYGTTKQQVLLESGDGSNPQQSVAVRMALGETQLVAETKQFLVENGIHLEVFDEVPKQRSKTVILVKNLDAQTTEEELRQLFSPHGELGRVLLPPRGVTAIVEFIEPTEAKAAFRKLAYSKFRHMPLYLEWAPVNVFRTAPNAKPSSEKKLPTTNSEAEKVNLPADNKADEEPEPDTTLFVKNLNFDTTDESMRKHFEHCGSIFSATVARKKDPKNPGQYLSMGFGFVQFWTKKATLTALKELQNSNLDGHDIELKRSNRTDDKTETVLTSRKTTAKSKEPMNSSKLLIRNVPFEAKTKEVAELFKPFGELKAVRMPQKSIGSGSHRGFAFIEFLTKQDAKRAFESLSASTHLYGRRLVLEWASSEDTVEDVRRRTTSHFTDGPSSKRSKGFEVTDGAIDSD